MSDTPIYVKTPKGIEEVNDRAHGLSLKSRRVLIVLDGKRSEEDVDSMFPDGEGIKILSELFASGFITPLNGGPSPEVAGSSPIKVATPGKPDAAETKNETKASPPANDDQRFEMAQNFMRNTINSFLGGMGSGLVNQVNKCSNIEELRGLYKPWKEAIEYSADGKKQAEDLENRLAALLS